MADLQDPEHIQYSVAARHPHRRAGNEGRGRGREPLHAVGGCEAKSLHRDNDSGPTRRRKWN